MSRPQPDEQMNVICDAAEAFGNTAQSFDGAAQVLEEAWPPVGGDERFAVLGREDEMIVEAQVR
jgi:hypothetical protein